MRQRGQQGYAGFHRTLKKWFLILEKIHERAKQRFTSNYSRLVREAIYLKGSDRNIDYSNQSLRERQSQWFLEHRNMCTFRQECKELKKLKIPLPWDMIMTLQGQEKKLSLEFATSGYRFSQAAQRQPFHTLSSIQQLGSTMFQALFKGRNKKQKAINRATLLLCAILILVIRDKTIYMYQSV